MLLRTGLTFCFHKTLEDCCVLGYDDISLGVFRHFESTYKVWYRSNETDFLLTMNFILFTNQCYSLQNSSLGQLHSDGGVVSIVRSSAGRLLLE